MWGRCFWLEKRRSRSDCWSLSCGSFTLKSVLLLFLAGTCNAGVSMFWCEAEYMQEMLVRYLRNLWKLTINLYPPRLSSVSAKMMRNVEPTNIVMRWNFELFFVVYNVNYNVNYINWTPFCTKRETLSSNYSHFRSEWSVFARRVTRVQIVFKWKAISINAM